MQVQIALAQLGLYGGSVNGVFDEPTRLAVGRFQLVKGLESDGQLNASTLAALGVARAR